MSSEAIGRVTRFLEAYTGNDGGHDGELPMKAVRVEGCQGFATLYASDIEELLRLAQSPPAREPEPTQKQREWAELVVQVTDHIAELDDEHGGIDEPYEGAGYCSCRDCQIVIPMLNGCLRALLHLLTPPRAAPQDAADSEEAT